MNPQDLQAAIPAQTPAADDDESRRSARWLSRGFEELVHALANSTGRKESEADFDAVIVGSGYGGAVAARELAAFRGDRKVCVLERGREYLPGMFPSRMADLASHVRFTSPGKSRTRGYREGLFDLRIGKDVSAVLGNGVGGGSLINAGVMLMPKEKVFENVAWPAELHGPEAFQAFKQRAEALTKSLGATHAVTDVSDPTPLKFNALASLQPAGRTSAVPITVALEGGLKSSAGVPLDKCVRCGDCATGCNHNAKVSLDLTLLADAVRFGAEIYAGATLLRIDKQLREGRSPLWELRLVHTDETLRRRQGAPLVLRTEHLILAAGTFGSTEILLRSESKSLRFSTRLGQQFSSNGDVIAAAYDGGVEVNCVGSETQPSTSVGPTITGCLDLRNDDEDGMAIQDLAVPGPLRRLMEEVVTTTAALHLLAEPDLDTHAASDDPRQEPAVIDAERIQNTLVVAIMSRDSADGVLKLDRGRSMHAGDGAITVHWPTLRDQPAFVRQHDKLRHLLDASLLRTARVLSNPLWRPLPETLEYLFGGETGPMLTVHPLGGCPMGDTAAAGVVDHIGRVFDRDERSPSRLHKGLAVLDGSIVPTSLGINPALTIASLASLAVDELRLQWGFDSLRKIDLPELSPRPRFAEPHVTAEPRATRIEIMERLSGALDLKGRFRPELHAELTMRFDPINVNMLTRPGAALKLDKERGRLRLFLKPPRNDKEPPDSKALLVASLSGSLRVLHREPSTPWQRRLRGGWSWFLNRGMRDSLLWGIDDWNGRGPAPKDDRKFTSKAWQRFQDACNLATRAGAVRLLEYVWTIESIDRVDPSIADDTKDWVGRSFKGSKRLTYSRRSNPWRQLSEVMLETFPGLSHLSARPVLQLDTGYLARQGVPLLRIVDQEDQPTALADLTSFALYLTRMLLQVHAWSFRLPDAPVPRAVDRLPGVVPGLPAPIRKELQVDTLHSGAPVMLRLTRYPFGAKQRDDAVRRRPNAHAAIETPVLLIHGYSASGTTFAHHAVRPNLVEALWNAGRDVWIVDLRSSAGMPQARRPWTFEDMAFADIPIAIDQVLKSTEQPKLDVVAHCMGSAMLGMALLGQEQKEGERFWGSKDERFWELREALPSRIRSLVISQVPPAMVFSPANVFRAYAMRYVQHYLPLENWQFRPSAKPGLGEQLIDRLLATLPYPQDEFDRENPLWTPWRRTAWVGARHRIDALYGRSFSVNNMSRAVLDRIDDQFGPLNIDTVTQVIHFAQFKTITNHRGFNEFLNPERFRERYTFPVLALHGADNGLASVQTLDRFHEFWCDAATVQPLMTEPLEGLGHQDSLIGERAKPVFDKIVQFFEQVAPLPAQAVQQAAVRTTDPVYVCQVPAFGVRLQVARSAQRTSFSIGDHGGRGDPSFAVLLPMTRKDGRWCLFDREADQAVEPNDVSLGRLAQYASSAKVEPTQQRSRYRCALNQVDFARLGDCVLVMLLYPQSQDTGARPERRIGLETSGVLKDDGLDFAPAFPAADPTLYANTDQLISKAILQALQDTEQATLELGLLEIPPLTETAREPGHYARGFVLASCQYPGGMVDRTPRGVPADAQPGPADASYLRLKARLDRGGRVPLRPSFLIAAGDQVYVDATAGLFDPKTLDARFDVAYENFLGARGPRSVLGRLPAYLLPDDHELDDNWEPDPAGAYPRRGPSNETLKARGRDAYLRYQRDVDAATHESARLWNAAVIEGLPFFLADSRTERCSRTAATVQRACLIGNEQACALDVWLQDRSISGPRFLVTGSMVLPRTLGVRSGGTAAALRSDAWDGYPLSLHRLLAQVYERGTNDVVFLSGDTHRGNVTTIELTREGSEKVVIAHSIHCPALYAPYPFANAVPEDFAHVDSFDFAWVDARCGPMTYRCSVQSWFPDPGDGFAVLGVVEKEGGGWQVEVEFAIDRRDETSASTKTNFDIL